VAKRRAKKAPAKKKAARKKATKKSTRAKAPKPAAVDPARLTPAQLAAMLTRLGDREFSTEDIEKDIEAGAPVNDDGSLSVVYFSAWLVREIA